MIKLSDGTWCYSPEMPIKYTQGCKGPGEWVGDDMPRWNILYLSEMQNFERLRLGKLSLKKFYEITGLQNLGRVQAAAAPELIELVPGMRESLTKPLSLFIHMFRTQDLQAFSVRLGQEGEWPDRVLKNALILWDSLCNLEDAEVESVMHETVGNVIRGNFGKK